MGPPWKWRQKRTPPEVEVEEDPLGSGGRRGPPALWHRSHGTPQKWRWKRTPQKWWWKRMPWKWMQKRTPQKWMWKRTPPPRSGGRRGSPWKWRWKRTPQKWRQKRIPPEVVVEEDQLRSTAGQVVSIP